MSIPKHLTQTIDFHNTFGHPVADSPMVGNKDLWELRYKLIAEELEEYKEACKGGDLVGIADALTDLQVVLDGTVAVHGMHTKIEAFSDEVYRSNMSKLGEDNKPIYREDGKILKGPNYSKPDLQKILDN